MLTTFYHQEQMTLKQILYRDNTFMIGKKNYFQYLSINLMENDSKITIDLINKFI